MARRASAPISTRKQPQQARSTGLVAAVLDAAVQVLAIEGAHRFTTARVAEKVGVSIGSLYQYFPNKAAILFRLQSDEWEQTARLLGELLRADGLPPLDRLRALVHAFIRSECEEASIRLALGDAAPLYRDAPEAQAAQNAGGRVVQEFLEEVLPEVADAVRLRAGDLIEATLTQVGKSFSDETRTPDEIAAFADSMADMFAAYLERLGARPGDASALL